MKRTIFLSSLILGVSVLTHAQSQISGDISKRGEKPTVAVPDFRGAGDAQRLMTAFNSTLWNDLQNSGQVKMVAKTFYPVLVPQQPADFRQPAGGQSQGLWLTDWSGPPANANYLAFGYTAVQGNQLVLY